ncbi:MAG: heavy metal-binding domain-containing protein [Planctomycetota bacterium]
MILCSTDTVPAREIIEHVGFVRASSVRSHHLGTDISSRVQGLVGGEVPAYTKLLAEVREESLDRMVREAQALGANAIVGIRYASVEISGDAAEILVYGTAVRIAE